MDKYEVLSEDSLRSITWASSGPDGSGKSHFGLTAPAGARDGREGIFVCAFDPYGMNRVGRDAKVGKRIQIARYPFDPNQFPPAERRKFQDAAGKVWDQFRKDYQFALEHCRSVLWDREDLMFELQRFANFGAQNDAPKEYGPLYSEIAWLVQKAQAAEINLGILRGVKDKWVSKFDAAKGKMVPSNTGEKIPDGMNKIPDYVDITLQHRWDGPSKSFMVKFDKFTNSQEKGEEYPNVTFTDMALSAYPDTAPEDWQ